MEDLKTEVLEKLYLQHESEIVEIQQLLNQVKWLSDTIYTHLVQAQAYKLDTPFDDNVRIANDILNLVISTLIDKVDILDKNLNVLDNKAS